MNEKYSNEESGKVTFTPPEGFRPPESASGKGTFDMVCTFKVEDGGKLCLTKLGQMPMPGYSSGSEHEDKEPSWKGMAGEMAGASQQQQQSY